MRKMDFYTVCLLAWFYGMAPGDVEKRSWTQEEVDKAQAYCETKFADPIEYCRTWWK